MHRGALFVLAVLVFGCDRHDPPPAPVPASTQPSIAVNVTSTSSPSALPKTFKWTSTGPLAQPKTGWLSLKDFSCVVYNNQYIVYMSTVNSVGELRRGHDDLHQLVSDGHSHPVLDPCRGRCADA